jgi:hypothetical protein
MGLCDNQANFGVLLENLSLWIFIVLSCEIQQLVRCSKHNIRWNYSFYSPYLSILDYSLAKEAKTGLIYYANKRKVPFQTI